MKLYRIGWTEEGVLWRKGDFVILKPRNKITYWRVRRVESRPLATDPGEADYPTEREAFRHANKFMRHEKKK